MPFKLVPVSTANVGSVSAEDKADFMRRKAEWEKQYPEARFLDLKMVCQVGQGCEEGSEGAVCQSGR